MSGSIRLFVTSPLRAGAAVAASAAQAHYLGRVMRRAAGEAVLLFNGRDGEWQARIGGQGIGGMVMEAERQTRAQTAEPDVWLLFAPLKRDLTELVVEKATELGASLIQPVQTARTNPVRLNAERLRLIATEAAEQSERLTVPRIEASRRLDDVLAAWPIGRVLVAAAEREAAPPPPRAAALLVGPEGGFAPAELDALRATPFVVLASLGPRILRAETAAIAGLALLQAQAAG